MKPLIEAKGLRKSFRIGRKGWFGVLRLAAVRGVDLEVGRGETLALVGESGSGKSTLARLLLRLVEPDEGRVVVRLDGEELDWSALRGRELRRRRRHLQIVFQDPDGSLDPRWRVRNIVAEGIEAHGLARGAERERRVIEALARVGLGEDVLPRSPAAFSGGQKQRIAIARALAVAPDFLVLDEAVAALDVSIQAQILALLADLQRRLGLSYLFISHDLAVVRQIADRVAVMYLGRLVEEGPAGGLFAAPAHPYTRALLEAVPVAEPGGARRRLLLPGEPPSPIDPPSGCAFHPRCPIAESRCRSEEPPALPAPHGGWSRCHFPERVGRLGEPVAQAVSEQARGEEQESEHPAGEDLEPPRGA